MQRVVNGLCLVAVIIGQVSEIFAQQKAANKCEEYYGPIETRLSFGLKDVAGGYAASHVVLPFMAALGYEVESEIKYFCGGSLISEDFVVTATHCIYSKTGGTVKYVRIGDLDLNSTKDDKLVQMFGVEKYHVHPKYKYPEKYHDIALIKLNKSVKFVGYQIRPICLSPGETPDLEYRIGGWGQLEYGMEGSNVLQVARLVNYGFPTCREHFTPDFTFPKGINRLHQLCAGPIGEDKIADTCEGDSGGPLAYVQRKAYYLAGVTSFGKPCALGLVPGIYTSVAAHIVWIENIVWPDNETEVAKEGLTHLIATNSTVSIFYGLQYYLCFCLYAVTFMANKYLWICYLIDLFN